MRKQERRSQVLACAREIFARKGYHKTSVSDIVEGAGIARGTFYLYFDNKRAIFNELLDGLIELLDQRLERIDPVEDVLAQLRQNVVGVVDLFLDNRELTRILVHEAVGLDPEFDQKLSEVFRRIHRMVEDSLRLGIEMKVVRDCDARIATRCVMGSVREVIHYLVVEEQASDIDRSQLVEELLAYSLFGLAASGALPGGTLRGREDRGAREDGGGPG